MEDFIDRIARIASKKDWFIYAWALMPNHFHLLARTGRKSLSGNMRSLMSGYAGYFNRRHKRHGHLFQNRFKSIVIEEETYFLELVRYIHLNPFRANIMEDISELEHYKYTGHSAIVGNADRPWQDTDEILGRFSTKHRHAIELYQEFLAAGATQGSRHELEGGGLVRSYGGWKEVEKLKRGREKYRTDERILGTSSFVEGILEEAEKQEEKKNTHVTMDSLIRNISKDMGINKEIILGRGRNRRAARARSILAYVWIRYLGQNGNQLAKVLGVSPQYVHRVSSQIEQDNAITSKEVEKWCNSIS